MSAPKQQPKLDKIIHERARLMILTYLASSEETEASFNELKEGLDLTSGNLSVQLKTLEEAGFVSIKKEFRGNKPYTGVSITAEGAEALSSYLSEMESLIRSLKGQ